MKAESRAPEKTMSATGVVRDGAAVSPPLPSTFCLQPSAFSVRVGINPISWSNDDLPSLGGEIPLETALAEGRAIGYEGFELGNKFPRDPEALRRVLADHGVALVSGWYSGELARRSRSAAEEIVAATPHLDKLARNGANVLVYGEVADSVQGRPAVPLAHRPRFVRADDWQRYGERLTAFAEHTLSAYGLRLAYHHHMGAYVQAPEDVDELLARTGEAVGLLFDSGHCVFGSEDGDNPLAMLDRHFDRVCHVHFKDVRPAVLTMARNRGWSFLESVLNGAFTVPGDGDMDFAPLVARLRAGGYRGWIVVEAEQDPVVAPSYQFAEKGFQTVRRLVADGEKPCRNRNEHE